MFWRLFVRWSLIRGAGCDSGHSHVRCCLDFRMPCEAGAVLCSCGQQEGGARGDPSRVGRNCFHQLMPVPWVSGKAWLQVDPKPWARCSQPAWMRGTPALDCGGDSALPGFWVSALLTHGAGSSVVGHPVLCGMFNSIHVSTH